MDSWSNTKLWGELSKLEVKSVDGTSVKSKIDEMMPKIETILKDGGTSPKDFTLHDEQHSFRVAQLMWEIIPEKTQQILSAYELALLLLSAYLHDIGMTPKYGKVENHKLCLKGNENKLTPEEKKEFQEWLDSQEAPVNLDDKSLNLSDAEVEKLLIYYCRHKHNDWSKEWIKTNLTKDTGSEIYHNSINDLINICQSHHWGLEKLEQSIFNPINISNKVVHKRYIAMCLRLADVMEIDPHRAPDILMKHRNVVEGSILHWLKEHEITSIDIINNKKVKLTAIPTRAFMYKAILDVANQIEVETRLCSELIREKPVDYEGKKYIWNIVPNVEKDIRESEDNNYQFIDGTFRPNVKNILQLLAGTELYGDPMIAIRELLQNAFDAVKVQVGEEIIEKEFTQEKDFNTVKDWHRVQLKVEKEKDNEIWLVCTDDGVGMDVDIIKQCFLVSGAQKRADLVKLERQCKAIGYDMELTGQFGIGAMSYFMLADKLMIKTSQTNSQKTSELNGLEFEIDGLDDFGELRKIHCDKRGTEIRLRIRKDLYSKFQDGTILYDFLQETLTRVPCHFDYESVFTSENLLYTRGWCKDEEFFMDSIFKSFIKYLCDVPMISLLKDERQKQIERFKQVLDQFPQSSNFLHCEGKLMNNNGYYRIHIPYFKNLRGSSLAFFFEESKLSPYLLTINDDFFYRPSVCNIKSWKGMSVPKSVNKRNSFYFSEFAFVELDLLNNSSSQISVSRLDLKTVNYDNLLNEVELKIQELIIKEKDIFIDSTYALYNYFQIPFIELPQNLNWVLDFSLSVGYFDRMEIGKVYYPILFHSFSKSTIKYKYENSKVFSFYPIYSGNESSINDNMFKYDRLVAKKYEPYPIDSMYFMVEESLRKNPYIYIGNAAQFPLEWKHIFCYKYGTNLIVLNENSPYFEYVNESCYSGVKAIFKDKTKSRQEKEAYYLKNQSNSLCYLLYLIVENQIEGYWIVMTEDDKEFVSKLCGNIFQNEKFEFYYINEHRLAPHSFVGLICLSLDGAEVVCEMSEILERYPVQGDEWYITRTE